MNPVAESPILNYFLHVGRPHGILLSLLGFWVFLVTPPQCYPPPNGAKFFAHDLCLWGGKLNGDYLINVTNMFANSNCAIKEDPDLNAVPKGPFCVQCY